MIWFYFLSKVLDVIYSVFEFVDIPSIPDDIYNKLNLGIDYIRDGLGVLGNYVDLSYVIFLFIIIAVIDLTLVTLKFIIWILRKIPLLGVS
jgi:hypothetical protein